ncbi:MAG: DUF167 domain-containing protein [Planctomycetes bacterium]|nr:DUF167 domain-containing protein [Planctomycetota bacterium]
MQLKVKVTPSSSKDAILGWLGDELKISLQAAPEKGRANKALLKFLCVKLSLESGTCKIISGLQSAHKKVELPLSREELDSLLNTILR